MSLDFSEIILSIEERERKHLLSFNESDVSKRPSPDKWSKKEILGHLIDSASNNHQRFVRALLTDKLEFPAYTQREWVKSQNYTDEGWNQLVELWSSYNQHLAHVVAQVPSGKLTTPCRIGTNDVMTLEALIADYVKHMEHHLKQLSDGK
ncbi:MAG TPA: DinB family protein [Candidatus Kryptonia bacterium]